MTETERLRAALERIHTLVNTDCDDEDAITAMFHELDAIATAALAPPAPTPDTRPALTPRQSEVLAFIRETIASRGCAPTVREIGRHFGVQNNAIQGHLLSLERKGRLRHEPGVCRTLSVVEAS